MNVRSIAIGVALALALATPALAKKPNYKHQGPDIQLNGGIQVATSEGDAQAALSGKLGIDIVNRVSLELQAEASRDAERVVITAQQRTKILTGRWQPFLVHGIGWGRARTLSGDSVRSAVALRFGGGLDYMITKHVSVGLDTSYVLLLNGLEDYATFGLGVRYGW